jgi:hypothetical protein
VVFDFFKAGNLEKVVAGEPIGTVVSDEGGTYGLG